MARKSPAALPIAQLRDVFDAADAATPLVITAPTGSGKSTELPRWCRGMVSVIEPRRVACKSLAARVASLEGSRLGGRVGYQVRDDNCRSAETELLFMTPGIALRRFEKLIASDVVILDEFHERALEVDLLLALLLAQYRGRLLVMSATLAAKRICSYLNGRLMEATGRAYPVVFEYRGGVLLPDRKQLTLRLRQALADVPADAGDILVFLPGKAEIRDAAAALAGGAREVIELHGGLSLAEQGRVFEASAKQRVVLATNVAETSLTVPNIGVVIDSGLVRRTEYHRGRGFLTLKPIALDSAEQRAGRAGRTRAGRCIRLWDAAARLEPTTPPAIRRESLLPLVIATAACGTTLDKLRFLDAPRDYAVEAAMAEATALGAVDNQGVLTSVGQQLFGLPLDAPLGRLLIEAQHRGGLADVIDLVSVLSVGRPLLRGRASESDEDPRRFGCDARAAIDTLRGNGHTSVELVDRAVLSQARQTAKRLRRAFRVDAQQGPVDRKELVRIALAADPRLAHVVRERRGRRSWSNGGTEVELSPQSALTLNEKTQALVAFESRALSGRRNEKKVVITCAAAVPLGWLAEAGLGREGVSFVQWRKGALVARVERTFARKVIQKREETPQGALARAALVKLIVAGGLFRGSLAAIRQRLQRAELAYRLAARDLLGGVTLAPVAELSVWLEQRLEELGVEQGEDIELLSPKDLLPDELPYELRYLLEQQFPEQLSTPEARYAVELDFDDNTVTLRFRDGHRGRTPSLSSLPTFPGFRIIVDTGRGLKTLRR